jgi:succinate dehydrogenase / fumarate reductase iron-sulfur subunit
MIINGRVRLACATLIEELEDPVTLMPLGKFPVVRDLVINRDSMLASMGRCELWLDVDDYELRSGELFSQDGDGQNRFEGCIFCGACLEACPQYCDRSRYMGAFVFGNMASLNLSTAGRKTSEKRFLLSAARGGVADCAGVSNCDMVCPAGIELSSAIGEINRSAISSSMKNYFRA